MLDDNGGDNDDNNDDDDDDDVGGKSDDDDGDKIVGKRKPQAGKPNKKRAKRGQETWSLICFMTMATTTMTI